MDYLAGCRRVVPGILFDCCVGEGERRKGKIILYKTKE